MRNINTIKNEEDYELALNRLNEIFNAPRESKYGKEADLLAVLINQYELEHYQLPSLKSSSIIKTMQ